MLSSESRRPGLSSVSLVLLVAVSRSVCSTDVTEIFPLCRPGREFWSSERAACSPCTKCAPEFTLSPCAIHKDAVCGPLSALELDWSFLSTRRKQPDHTEASSITSKMLWRFPEPEEQRDKISSELNDEIIPNDGNFRVTTGRGIDERDSGSGSGGSSFIEDIQLQDSFADTRERRRSSGGESGIPWDWQTSALVLAVCACIVFFLVAGCSALVYVRQWRRMKRNFEPAGLEEISARLNLMVKAELAELTAGAPMNPGDPETRCQYLEKLLDRKREAPVVSAAAAAAAAAAGWPEADGNLYIEEGETPRKKRAEIARIHRNIESILSHKNNRE